MEGVPKYIKKWLLTAVILILSFFISLIVQKIFRAEALIPTVFVLGVFLISLMVEGYSCSITASFVSVLAVNFAFTFPYFKLNFSVSENLFSAVIMLIITILTSALTTKVKKQNKLKAETERERMRANLLRAVSHDLRTPLTSIYGSSSAILENYDELNREQKLRLLKEVREDSEWLIHMVENLLSVTRIDDKKVEITKMPTVIEELFDAVLVKFQKRYPKQEIAAEVPDEFIMVPMDAMLIEQVLMNLLENAVKHARGMTCLSMRLFLRNEKAVFQVEDNGCGIAKERIPGIFSGYQGEETLSADGKRRGMGIGLSVCAAIVKAHGGEITVRNRKDGGALFEFSLDLEETGEMIYE